MIQAKADVRHPKSRLNQGVSIPEAAPLSLMAWIPCLQVPSKNQEDGYEEQVDRLIHQYSKKFLSQDQDKLQSIGKLWKEELKNYLPSFPAKAIVLIHEKNHTGLIPTRHSFRASGIEEQSTGWIKMMKLRRNETIYRMALLGRENIKLYEIIEGIAQLVVDMQASMHRRYETMDAFSKTIQLLQKDHRGPLITLGTGDGIHELDLMMLSKRNQIIQHYKQEPSTSIFRWIKQAEQCGWPKVWSVTWAKKRIEVAKQAGKWITQPNDIQNAFRKNKVVAVFGHDSSTVERWKKNKEIYLMLQNNVPFNDDDVDEYGLIIR